MTQIPKTYRCHHCQKDFEQARKPRTDTPHCSSICRGATYHNNRPQSPHRPCTIADCPNIRQSRGLCKMHYTRLRVHGSTDAPGKTRSLEMKFWENVTKTDICWLWTGKKTPQNYGRLGRQSMAHRISVELDGRTIPPKHVVDHLCRNTLCVNPAHLQVITHAENIRRGYDKNYIQLGLDIQTP